MFNLCRTRLTLSNSTRLETFKSDMSGEQSMFGESESLHGTEYGEPDRKSHFVVMTPSRLHAKRYMHTRIFRVSHKRIESTVGLSYIDDVGAAVVL